MQGREDGDAESRDQLQNLDLIADVEVVGGLVEDEVVGALGQRPGDQHPLFLAPRQGVEAALGEMLTADPFDGLGHDAPVLVVVPVEGPLVRGAADHDHLEDGEVELGRGLLGDDGHATGGVPGAKGQQVGAVEEDLAGGRAVHPVHRFEDGGLAAPVGSEQADEVSVGYHQVDVGDDAAARDVNRQPA